MVRLIDRLLADPRLEPAWAELRAIPHVDITRAAHLFYESAGEDRQERWDYTRDFPNIVPPFQTLWMEFDAPTDAQTGEPDATWDAMFGSERQRGVIVRGHTPAEFNHTVAQMGLATEQPAPETMAVVTLEQFVYFAGENPVILPPQTVFMLDINSDGQVIRSRGITHPTLPPEMKESFISATVVGAFPFAFALALLNSDLVTLSDLPDERTRQQMRDDERRGVGPVRFKELAVDRLTDALDGDGKRPHVGLRSALEAIRGHFPPYSPERPTLVKAGGDVWRPPRV